MTCIVRDVRRELYEVTDEGVEPVAKIPPSMRLDGARGPLALYDFTEYDDGLLGWRKLFAKPRPVDGRYQYALVYECRNGTHDVIVARSSGTDEIWCTIDLFRRFKAIDVADLARKLMPAGLE